MRLNALVTALAVAASAPAAHAQSTPDPLFENDAHAKAALECHADYVRRFAKAPVKPQATPTEVATAAYAYCIGQLNEYIQSVAATAKSSDDPKIFMDPEKYQAGRIAEIREYSFAYALHAYLTSTTEF